MRDDNGSFLIDHERLNRTIKTAMRMLDNVIDINFYAVARQETQIYLKACWIRSYGFSGYTSCFKIPYCSDEAVEFADKSMEMISYCIFSLKRISGRERLLRDFQGFIMGSRYSSVGFMRLLEQGAEERC